MSTVQGTYADPNEPHILNFVPDEICIVAVARTVDQEAEPRFYQHVRSQLNRQIAALLKVADIEPENPLESDLRPTVLRRRFAIYWLAALQHRTFRSD